MLQSVVKVQTRFLSNTLIVVCSERPLASDEEKELKKRK